MLPEEDDFGVPEEDDRNDQSGTGEKDRNVTGGPAPSTGAGQKKSVETDPPANPPNSLKKEGKPMEELLKKTWDELTPQEKRQLAGMNVERLKKDELLRVALAAQELLRGKELELDKALKTPLQTSSKPSAEQPAKSDDRRRWIERIGQLAPQIAVAALFVFLLIWALYTFRPRDASPSASPSPPKTASQTAEEKGETTAGGNETTETQQAGLNLPSLEEQLEGLPRAEKILESTQEKDQ